jgi:hypothetical protein
MKSYLENIQASNPISAKSAGLALECPNGSKCQPILGLTPNSYSKN